MAIDELTAVARALSSDTRVRIIQLLRERCTCPNRSERCACVNAIAHHLGISQAAVSQHLRVLKEVGLVSAQRRGYYVHYSLRSDVLASTSAMLADLASAGTN